MCVGALASVLLTSRYPPSSHRASRELGSLHPVSFLGTSSFFSSTFTYDLNPFPLIRLRAHHRQHTPPASSPTSSSRVYTTQKTPTHKTLLRPSVPSGNHCGPVVCQDHSPTTMSSGSSSVGSASAENATAPGSQEQVHPSEVSPLQSVMACWMVLGVGKDRLFVHDVDNKSTKSFRVKQ